MSKPNLFIVGAPKCGTTSMHKYLAQHPEIFLSSYKEPHYFSPDVNFFWRFKELPKYLSLFESTGNVNYVGESSPGYIYSEVAPQQIKAFSPDAKIIIMLRNPPDMLYSLHGEFLLCRLENILDFSEALAAQEDRRQGKRIPSSCEEANLLFYFDWVKYSVQVKRYLDVFGKENVHIILFNELVENTANVYRQTLEFLGVDPNFEVELKVINAAKPLPNFAVRTFCCKYPYVIKNLRGLFSDPWVDFILYDIGKLTQPQRPKKIDPEVRLRLMKQFQPEIEALAHLLNWDDHRLQLWLQ